MIAYPPALRRSGFGPPRAIRHFSDAIAEARAAQTPQPSRPAPVPKPVSAPVPLHPRPPRHVVRLWLPTTLIFLLLAPFAFLLAPLLYWVPSRYASRPFATVIGLGGVLLSLGGTDVDVETPDALVRIRLF